MPDYHLLEKSDRDKKLQPGTDADHTDLMPDKAVRCRHCQHIITHPSHKLDVNGQHIYCFRNPTNVDFVIGCFSHADGCRTTGEDTPTHSWFNGYHWSIALCGQCGTHLGWRYTNKMGKSFFGLIITQLLE